VLHKNPQAPSSDLGIHVTVDLEGRNPSSSVVTSTWEVSQAGYCFLKLGFSLVPSAPKREREGFA
jgi:hypothetical protein